MDSIQRFVSVRVRNLRHMLDDLTLTNYIRIAAVVCTYLLVRPYLLRFGAQMQQREHEKAMKGREKGGAEDAGKQTGKEEATATTTTTATSTGANIGKNTRKDDAKLRKGEQSDGTRQRKQTSSQHQQQQQQQQDVRQILDVQEKQLLDDDQAGRKAMEELLVDYDEEDWAEAAKKG